MLPVDALKDLLSQDLTDREKALICLAVEPVNARGIKEIKTIAFGAGWRKAKNKNLSAIYGRAVGLTTRTADGWELTSDGTHFVAKLAGPLMNSPIPMVASSLRANCKRPKNYICRSFFRWSAISQRLSGFLVSHWAKERVRSGRSSFSSSAHLVLLRSSSISQRVFELETRRGLSQELIRSVGTSFSHTLPDGS